MLYKLLTCLILVVSISDIKADGPMLSVEQAVDNAKFIFTGKAVKQETLVISTVAGNSEPYVVTHFLIKKIYKGKYLREKGPAGDTVSIFSSIYQSRDRKFVLNETYLIFLPQYIRFPIVEEYSRSEEIRYSGKDTLVLEQIDDKEMLPEDFTMPAGAEPDIRPSYAGFLLGGSLLINIGLVIILFVVFLRRKENKKEFL